MRSAYKKKPTQKNSIMLQKLKDLAAEAEDDEEIVSVMIPKKNYTPATTQGIT